MAIGKGKFGFNTLFMVLIITIAVIYLFNNLVPQVPKACTPTEITDGTHGCSDSVTTYMAREFQSPSEGQLDTWVLWVFRIVILGVGLYIGMGIMMGFQGGIVNRKQIFSLIVIGLLAWFLWDKVLVQIWDAQTLEQIAQSVAKKVGFG